MYENVKSGYGEFDHIGTFDYSWEHYWTCVYMILLFVVVAIVNRMASLPLPHFPRKIILKDFLLSLHHLSNFANHAISNLFMISLIKYDQEKAKNKEIEPRSDWPHSMT